MTCIKNQRQRQHKGSTAPPTPTRGSDSSITTRSHPHTASAETSHTTLTWVERNFGYAVARAYAGHTEGGSETGATATYVRASLAEVAAALAALTGEPHPLATTEGW
jgi:hypothetical protein